MLNILSREEKKKIVLIYRLRLAVVFVLAIAAFLLSSLVLFIPSYVLAVSRYNDAKADLATLNEKTLTTEQERDVLVKVVAVNRSIDLFLKTGAAGGPTASSVINKILSLKGSGVKIVGLTYEIGIENQERVVVTGIAADRDSLAKFVEVIKNDPTFTSIDLPISIYVKSTDINFSAVIIKGQKK